MKPSNHLSKYAIFLAMGFAIGMGAANFFAAGGNEGEATLSAAAKNPKAYTPSAPRDMPKKLAANLGPVVVPMEEGAVATIFDEDVSLSETVDANREETAATEPSPEERVRNQPAEHPATQRLSLKGTDELESKLRFESENAAPKQTGGNEALPEHERP